MTTIHKKDMILHDGEVHVVDLTDSFGNCFEGIEFPVIYSTKELENVPHLNRVHFVKPKEDVEELALKEFPETDNKMWNIMHTSARDNFKAGYKANKAEFTIEELKTAWAMGVEQSDAFDAVIKLLRPIFIPEYIVIDNDEIVEVKW